MNAAVLTVTGINGLIIFILGADFNIPAIATLNYFVHAFAVIYYLSVWLVYLQELLYTRTLCTMAGILIAALVLSRVISMPYLVSDLMVQLENCFCVVLSGILYLLRQREAIPVKNQSTPSSSLTMKKCLPVLLVYFGIEICGRCAQTIVKGDGLHLLLYFSPAREIVVLIVFLVALLLISAPSHAKRGINRKCQLFLLIGLAIGLSLGMLLGLFYGANSALVMLDFIETVRALLRSCVLIALFLLAYESSLPIEKIYGVFIVLPVVLSRLCSALIVTFGGDGSFPDSALSSVFIAVIAFAFLLTLVCLCLVVLKSNAGMTIFAEPTQLPQETSKQHSVDLIAKRFKLTQRESEILTYLVIGWSAKRIGEHLHISPFTVQNHTKCIYRKLDIHSKDELMDLVEEAPDAP